MQGQDEPIRVIGDTSQCIIPREERSQDSEKTSRLLDFGIRRAHRCAIEVGDTKEEECHIEGEEEGEEGDG